MTTIKRITSIVLTRSDRTTHGAEIRCGAARAIRERRYAVYDLEWDAGTMVPKLYGFYAGGRYAAFRTVDAFMKFVLKDEHKGWWFFAHAGGVFDAPFLFTWLVNHPSYRTTARLSGSAAVMVEVAGMQQGGLAKARGSRWVFADSHLVMPESLRTIEKRIGGATAMAGELHDYNERDCRMLHGALRAAV